MSVDHVDVLIVGAGLSGIGAAYYLKTQCPTLRYALLEARESLGGTWDLFRYPGIRSDSDMYTLGYSFRPWQSDKSIADGASILQYLKDTARENGIDQHIRYRQRAKRAEWSSRDGVWKVEVEQLATGGTATVHARFLFMCSGYYRYDQGYSPDFPGRERFQGRIVHPQHWTPDIDYQGKRVVVIGSGATAVTLVPELAKQAAHVTMLQRSPTYVMSLPAEDPLAKKARSRLPAKLAHDVVRWKNVLVSMAFYNMSKRRPDLIKRFIVKGVRSALGPAYDVSTHFTPRYNPWDQRVCFVPDGDMFRAIRKGRASVVTDHIDSFTERGIKLRSGAELEADLAVTATGLNLLALGGLSLSVDGSDVELSQKLTYKGMMLDGVPNLFSFIGYTNASWTLKCDLTAEYACRLINHMQRHGYRQCAPRSGDASIEAQPWVDFSAGYVLRSIDQFPRQGHKAPWRVYQNYARDLMALRYGKVDDGVMQFSRA